MAQVHFSVRCDPSDVELRDVCARIVHGLGRSVNKAVRALHEGFGQAAQRQQLAQASASAAKLDAALTAGHVELTQRVAEFEATMAIRVEERVDERMASSDAARQEAIDQASTLSAHSDDLAARNEELEREVCACCGP
jgi:hypothetical protein